MELTAIKSEQVKVNVTEDQVAELMLTLLKEDYNEFKDAFKEESPKLLEAIKIVYEAYSGKPIDYVERWSH